ncbi:hypothetical protein HJG60_011169 [Phyllostomus discolor]|uniref:Uncharacterized protein n=1 Tax=Phyllostomus discolor TaxID=89673 RepID=A0A834E7I0_9CHIR|nr:hypothetical protein HJG60_011169 [Phyllostomus discolor]
MPDGPEHHTSQQNTHSLALRRAASPIPQGEILVWATVRREFPFLTHWRSTRAWKILLCLGGILCTLCMMFYTEARVQSQVKPPQRAASLPELPCPSVRLASRGPLPACFGVRGDCALRAK